ncbi:MAG: histone H1 [Bacteroidetes bacterium]|nr:MAG: histone H1 [Bacteroidota bacterium]
MEKYEKLKSLVISIQDDFMKFYEKNNKAAGTRARKAMQDLKNLAQEIRNDIQAKKNAD